MWCKMQVLRRQWHPTPVLFFQYWTIPWIEEPGRLQSMWSLRVGHDWATSLSLFTFMHWRRKWEPTPVFLPGESQGRGSLVGCRLWGCTESDTTEVMQQQQRQNSIVIIIAIIKNHFFKKKFGVILPSTLTIFLHSYTDYY